MFARVITAETDATGFDDVIHDEGAAETGLRSMQRQTHDVSLRA